MVVPDIAPEINDPTLHAEPQVNALQPIDCPTFSDLAIPTPPLVMIDPDVVDIVSVILLQLIDDEEFIIDPVIDPVAIIDPP
jgi:hypothetical protein